MHHRAALAAVVLLLLAGEARADVWTEPAQPSTTTTFDVAGHDREIQRHARFLDGRRSPKAAQTTTTLTLSATEIAREKLPVVKTGDVIAVRAVAGRWTVDSRKIAPVGIAGHGGEHALHRDWGHMRLIQSLPFGRLLMRVGDSPWLDAGRGVPVQTFVGGPLQFAINDNPSSYGDNSGAIDLEVQIGAGPPFTEAPPQQVKGPTAPPLPTTKPTPPEGASCPDSLCAAGERCVLVQVQCVAAPCPAQPMCVDR